jgi:DNA-binding XRE family transcriptional regulator
MIKIGKFKGYTQEELVDRFIGKIGTPRRDKYEFELRMDVLGDAIRSARKQRNLTQEQLGALVGVQKAHISKLERSAKNTTLDTILKIFNALNATITFNIDLHTTKRRKAA